MTARTTYCSPEAESSRRCWILSATLVLILICVFPSTGGAQNIHSLSGQVRDAANNEPLPHCNVFLANTTIGVISDLEGRFIISNIPKGRYQLVANRVGYHSFVTEILIPAPADLFYSIKLEEKPVEAGQVLVVADAPKEWRSQLARFKRAFIGETPNARDCQIENPEVLRFECSALNSELLAFCDSTLRITNRALGYRLHVVLELFKWGDQEGHYKIYPRFEPLEPEDEKERAFWEKNRRRTWLGSFRHFVSSLAQGEAEREGFQLFLKEAGWTHHGDDGRTISDAIVEKMPGLATKLHFNGLLEVRYRSSENTSMIKLNQNFVIIEERGEVYPPLSIVLYGEWARHRVADILPFDFNLLEPEN